ncbi:MAG: serine protease Do [Chloroflexota bacterium]|nr:serine protease Do [Chloroflexota bacterium]
MRGQDRGKELSIMDWNQESGQAPQPEPDWHTNQMPADWQQTPAPAAWTYSPVATDWQPAPAPAPAEKPARRSVGSWRTLVAAALLSSSLASVSTFALLSSTTAPAAAPTGTTPAAAAAQAASTPSTVTAGSSVDVTAMIATAKESVVTITTSVGGSGLGRGGASGTGVGSGIVLSADGTILTNAHVVAGATSISVKLPNGNDVAATVVTSDTAADLAVIHADASGLTPARLGDSDALKVGQAVIAIGTPLGEYADTVTAGIISATNRTITVSTNSRGGSIQLTGMLQTDAAVNPGNSGGPLLNAAGQVVGIVAAGDESGQGIGFAIPINDAAALISHAQA